MERMTKTERKEKRKALRPWKRLTIWCIIFALTFSIFTPMFYILDNDFMLVIPGSLWKMKNADPSATYYPVAFDDETEALAYGEMVARQVSEEGIVLLTNQSDALPLPQSSRISLFSTSSVNPVMGGTGSGRVDAGSSDTMKEAMEKEGFVVNPKLWDFYDAIPSRDMRNNSGFSAIAGKQSATAFASPFVMGSTFNNELIYQVGYVIGNDCLRYGISALYGPGGNTHRTAYGGRNFEYFSEDPFLSGEMAASYVGAAEKLGVNTLIKHFALNDCETDRQGLGVWLGEQAAREIYLKAFQKSFEEASANGVMAAYTRWGAIWSGGNSALIRGILRGEWGCDGWIITDNVATDLITVADGLRGGINAFDASLTLLLDFEQYEDDPYIRTLMREACHRGLYALVNSAAMNGVGPNTEISKVVFWPATMSLVLAIVCWGSSAFCAVRWHRRRKEWFAKKQSDTKNN